MQWKNLIQASWIDRDADMKIIPTQISSTFLCKNQGSRA